MKRSARNLIIRMSGNAQVQRLLEWNVLISQYLMGIGSGSSTDSSGEQALVDKLKQQYATVGKPLCVFDVGANKGQFLGLIGHGLQGVSLQIHAFEPSKHTYEDLCFNSKDYENVTLNNIALGKQTGEVELFYDKKGSGIASIYRRRLGHFDIDLTMTERVRIDTLDNYCAQCNVSSIDLLKLDVEGHELAVLQGGVRMFSQQRIRMISFEFGGCNIDSRTYFQDFYYFFKENGMKEIFRIVPSGQLVPIHRYQEIHEQFRTTNFLVLQGAEPT